MGNSTLCILGCGNLGGAILKSLIDGPKDEEGVAPFNRFIACVRSEASEQRLAAQFSNHSERLVITRDNVKSVQESDVIVLGVDPSVVEKVLSTPGLSEALSNKLLISVAAGWTRQKLETTLYGSPTTNDNTNGRAWVVRTLPNIAASVSQGLTAIEISEPEVPNHYQQITDAVFQNIGKTVHIPPTLMDATTAVAGSTPAFFAVIVDAMIDAAVAVGVPRDLARTMTVQAMTGTAALLQSGMHPAVLRDQGTSPEGCTIGGLMVMEEAGVRGHVGRALREAPLYLRGSQERAKVEEALTQLRSQLPVRSEVFYNGVAQSVSKSVDQPMPSEHATTFTNYPLASKEQVAASIESALKAKKSWEETPFVDRAAIFLKAAELATGKYRYELIAATMLGQGKNVWQGEIDAAAELADFFRQNCNFAAELLEKQPTRGTDGMWSRMEYRPLEGFVYAVSPFNFTALGGSLVSAPALMGNVVVWKPSPSSIYASTLVYKILLEAGLPPDVVQFVPGDAQEVTSVALSHRDFAGLNFIGSSDVFRSIYGKIGEGIANKTYREFPRVVGETSGKNFHLIHNTADIPSAVNHTIRGAFEYQGQKCSATSRVYLPESRAEEFLTALKAGVKDITIGSPDKDFEAFMGPVIHRQSFNKIKSIIDASNKDPSLTLLAGGTYDDSVGFYVNPTVYQAHSLDHRLFDEEIFGPVLAIYVYPDAEWSSILQKADQQGGGFALTGAVFAKDRRVIREAEDALRYSAGNFYINCKTTAALIGQQSFGGARASGTNDKAGSSDMLRRFTSPRMIKEEFFPLEGYTYPSNH
ncbi:putative pyrroline-5-carboxylate dehydrogenase [Aspergillus bertholletiae]|uniref:L-glutamate gamma-semialdehyde dehydrogenase n=1 Tax=Aspergillus bertholletiae TaxID=1226010 RepID=A0A5N7B611_9EURO|nr:putative pyrroline-5-carboxylate dehydrogenase [Aspergillus bertholletiae]